MCAAASRTLAKFQTFFNPEIEKPLERSSLRAEYKPLATSCRVDYDEQTQ
jgi:hypothetical protein